MCDADRAWLAAALRDLPDLCAQLAAQGPVLEVGVLPMITTKGTPIVDEDGAVVYGDRLSALAPAGPIASAPPGGHVTGTPEASTLLSLTRFDLLAAARKGTVRDPWSDQYGLLPVATVLESWVDDWRDQRRLPPGPPPLAAAVWLGEHLEWACDYHPAVGDFAAEVRELRSALHSALGLVEVPDYKRGVPCRRCDKRTLYTVNGSSWVECGSCAQLLSDDEYRRWVKLLSTWDRTTLLDQYQPGQPDIDADTP